MLAFKSINLNFLIKLIYILLLSCFHFSGKAQQQAITVDFKKLDTTHDLSLSPWGPYSKKYAGISHINEMQSGMRFDFIVVPGFYRGKLIVPNLLFASDFFPWQASADMRQFTYRYELEWKDKVYVDVTYYVRDSSTVLVGIKAVNKTTLPQNVGLNLLASIEYPDGFSTSQIEQPEGILWKNAVDYTALDLVDKSPFYDLPASGWLRNEVRSNTYIDGRAVGEGFGRQKGDKVSYTWEVPPALAKGNLGLLFRGKKGSRSSFRLSGFMNDTITLEGTGQFEQVVLPYQFTGNKAALSLISDGGEGIELNGVWLSPAAKQKLNIIPRPAAYEPILYEKSADQKNIILQYKDVNTFYGVAWYSKPFVFRETKNDELDVLFRRFSNGNWRTVFEGNNKGHFANVFIRPVELPPMSEKTTYALLCAGSYASVKDGLATLESLKKTGLPTIKTARLENILPEGEKFRFSQQLMQATVLSDIVYPVYTQGPYIRHFTPGKTWNSLYTWDAGLINQGLTDIDINKSIEFLNTYTTPKNSQAAFIHYGSPVPTQQFAFFDIWNKTNSKELLDYFYPRLKRYCDFLAGHTGSSTTRTLPSNLLKTWDYFYNSGGWDDYPAQESMHSRKAEKFITPVITTAMSIRVAKMLRLAAEVLNKKEDIKAFDKDIQTFSSALQQYSWDKESGYFSYVVHDSAGHPVSFFRHSSDKNYNMGLDGAYPLFAGICTPTQDSILVQKLFSEDHLWTPSGMGVVDQSAPYFRSDGYWNGTVWMPHQFFMWKAMLDLGKPALAFKIANTALNLYERETAETYYTYEHFFAKTGRGAGWHQFSGLSNPVLPWFSAYYKPGTVTTGYEIWIDHQTFNKDLSSFTADLRFDKATKAHPRSMVICLNPAFAYDVRFDGKPINTSSRHKGLLELVLPPTNGNGKLEVKATGVNMDREGK